MVALDDNNNIDELADRQAESARLRREIAIVRAQGVVLAEYRDIIASIDIEDMVPVPGVDTAAAVPDMSLSSLRRTQIFRQVTLIGRLAAEMAIFDWRGEALLKAARLELRLLRTMLSTNTADYWSFNPVSNAFYRRNSHISLVIAPQMFKSCPLTQLHCYSSHLALVFNSRCFCCLHLTAFFVNSYHHLCIPFFCV